MLCRNAEFNEFGRLICKIKKAGKETSQLCPYAKYCHQKMKWENSPSMDKCSKKDYILEESAEGIEKTKKGK